MKIFLIIITSIFFMLSQKVYAEEKKSEFGPKAQAATIIYAGLGGAVLGLSTLSFYGAPEEHLSNISIGFALGIISGTIYVTNQVAATYATNSYLTTTEIEELQKKKHPQKGSQAQLFSYSWQF